MTIRTILVDDESLAIQGLALRLQAHEDVEIVETCTNGREAIRAIKTHKPDLVFLDIQMPGFDGFSVVQGMMEVEPPLFIFVTAYSDHAIRAFEAQAVDYLMKPVEEGRLADALDRVRQRLTEKRQGQEVEKLREVLAFQLFHRSTIVNLSQVRQVKPHTNGECFLVLESGAQVKVSRSYRDVVARFVH
mgnify:CR=1 FL=1